MALSSDYYLNFYHSCKHLPGFGIIVFFNDMSTVILIFMPLLDFQMSGESSYSRQDPDYEAVIDGPTVSRRREEEQSNREGTLVKISKIIEKQFDNELQLKEDEILLIDGRISQAKLMLDKLRAYLLANYYGYGGKVIKGKLKSAKKKANRPSNISISNENTLSVVPDKGSLEETDTSPSIRERESKRFDIFESQSNETEQDRQEYNRFYTKKQVIVGNISKFIPLERRERNDQATHKWMVYVRSPPGEPSLDTFIQRMWFFLHPSYMPNDIIEISRPPFTITRRGWGEFPVRIQILFNDPQNKPVDVIHNLKLDKTYTGLQTLGAETIVEIELQRHSVLAEETNREDTAGKVAANGKGNAGVTSSRCPNPSKQITDDTMKRSKHNIHDSFINELPRDTPALHLRSRSSEGTSAAELLRSSPVTTSQMDDTSLLSSDAHEENTISMFDAGTDHALARNVSHFPLICKSRDITKLHYCAKTIQQYKGWSHSKRRASEWQRALDIKRSLLKNQCAEGLSTKQVMIWCRQHGYTPSEVSTAVVDWECLDFCPCCGRSFPVETKDKGNGASSTNNWCGNCLSNITFRNIYSLTSFSSLITDLGNQDCRLSLIEQTCKIDDENLTIDIVSDNDNLLSPGRSTQSYNVAANHLPIIITPEIDWIFEAAAQIEVHLPPVDTNSGEAPLLQYMMLIAMKSFLKEMLSNSYALAKQNSTSNRPVVLTPTHIHQILKVVPHFDFLTDRSLGIEEEDGSL